jgi:hypothetical protein
VGGGGGELGSDQKKEKCQLKVPFLLADIWTRNLHQMKLQLWCQLLIVVGGSNDLMSTSNLMKI